LYFQNAKNKGIFERHRIKARKSRIINGSGVNLKSFPFEPYPEDGGFRFLFVGRVMKEKGIEEFLAAAEALHSETVHFQVLGFCEEAYQARLEQMARAGLLEQLGFSADVRPYYQQASAVVLPSSYNEGMSNVLQEASATGRPVIASDIVGCRETFDEGETGFGFRKGDAKDLVRVLQHFMALSVSERAEMGRKGREKMIKEFDRKQVVAAYIEEIETIYSTNPRYTSDTTSGKS
jgi:galacturonosyltransferase